MLKLCNTTELVAKQILDQIVISKIVDGYDLTGYCFCERCLTDSLSLALNNLPPRYVVSEEGEVFARTVMELDYQFQATVNSELIKALLQVGAHPHHELD